MAIIEDIDTNFETLNNQAYLSGISNVIDKYNNFLQDKDIAVDTVSKILSQLGEAYSFCEQIKNSSLTKDVSLIAQLKIDLDNIILDIQTKLDNGDLKGDTGNIFDDLTVEQLLTIKGDTGDTGSQGIQGLKGDTGDTGSRGIQGLKGDTGDTGSRGIQGLKGDTGDTGSRGIQGLKGDTGDTGSRGINGEDGQDGSFDGALKTINDESIFGEGDIKIDVNSNITYKEVADYGSCPAGLIPSFETAELITKKNNSKIEVTCCLEAEAQHTGGINVYRSVDGGEFEELSLQKSLYNPSANYHISHFQVPSDGNNNSTLNMFVIKFMDVSNLEVGSVVKYALFATKGPFYYNRTVGSYEGGVSRFIVEEK